MNGKKILLITTLVATLILISLVALFAKFILDIDFGKLGSSEQSETQQIEQQQEEPQQNQPDDKQEPQQKPLNQTEDGKQEQKEEEDDKKEENEEEKYFETTASLKSASVTVKAEQDIQLKVEEEQQLAQLWQEVGKLKLKEIHQSVGVQSANWEATLALQLDDGSAAQLHLYESNLTGSKATLSVGETTYESTESIAALRTLLEGWVEEEQNQLEIGAEQFEAASRVLALDMGSMEVQDIAGAKQQFQQALGKLKVTETMTGSINPGNPTDGISMVNLSDEEDTLFTMEFYQTGILAYRSPDNQTFYVCDPQSLNSFYQTVEQLCTQVSSTPASLAWMDYGALDSMVVTSNAGKPKKEVGLIRDHAQTLFGFLQQLHVSKGSVREEKKMFNKPEYHMDIEFSSGMVMQVDLSKGSLLVDGGDGVILHYTLIGDRNLELVRAELERLTADS